MAWRRHVSLLLVLPTVAAVSACTSGGIAQPGRLQASLLPACLAKHRRHRAGTATPGTATTATPSASASAYSVRTGPITEEFDTPLPTDQAQAQVVAGFREGLILWNKSQENFGLVAPVTSYVTGSALDHLEKSLTSLAQMEDAPAGVDRLFRTTVTMLSGTSATITSCDDASKYDFRNPRTGAVNPSYEHLPIGEVYTLDTWGMSRLGGHWAISSNAIAPPGAAAARPCLP